MAWYLMLDALSIEDLPSGSASVGIQILKDGSGNAVVPVFTSEERYWDLADECEFEGDPVKPFPMPFDIFVLGELLRPLGESEGTQLVAVDPFVVEDDWESLARLCSVEEFCFFLEKLHPVARGWAQEGLTKFGDDPKEAERILDWVKPHMPEKLGDIQAVVREHLVEDNH